jgi:nitrite reductase/ring-hydroxylating ferredoxin subunit
MMETPRPSGQADTAATITADAFEREGADSDGEPAEGECREFTYRYGEEEREGFVVRSGGRLHAYRNACPHTGAPLNWSPNRFLTEDGDYLICALHGALFRIEDGLCVAGPCHGQRLEKLTAPMDPDGAGAAG